MNLIARWMLPLIVALGFAGSAVAGGQGHDNGHGGDCGCGNDSQLTTFMHVFLGKVGRDFGKVIDFKIDGTNSLFSLTVLTSGLENLTFSIFEKKSGIEVYDSGSFSSASDPVWSDSSINLAAGKYFALFTGTIAAPIAGYAGFLVPSPVPEPGEWMMILAGISMMGFVVARRRSNT